MRKLIIAATAVVLLAGAGGGGLWAYHRLSRDPLKDAAALLAKGDVQGAGLVLREAVQKDPKNAKALARLGGIQIMLGDPVAAERELRAAQAAGYKGADLMPLLARALLAQRRGAEVLAQFVPDGLPPTDAADLLVTRGLAHLAAGDPLAARGSAEAAEHLAPKMPEAAVLMARAAIVEREPGWALAALDRALKLNPNLTQALLLKAGVLRAEGRPEDALPVLEAAEKSAKTPPDLASARLSRAGALLAAGRDAEAVADLDLLLKQFPKSPGGNFLKALAQIRADDWTGADATLEVIQPVLSRLPRGEYYLALVKSNLKQLEQASEAIGHYTAKVPRDPDGWRLTARIDLLAGRKDDAERALAQVVVLTKGHPAGEIANAAATARTPAELTRLAALQVDSGDTAGAERDLQRSLALLPSPADVAIRSVMAALRVGDVDRASAALERLRKLPNASPAQVAALSGAVRLSLLDLDGARTAFADGLKDVPDSIALKLDLSRVLLLQGHVAEADALLTPVLNDHPANRLALATMLEILVAERQPNRVAPLIAAARAAAPGDPMPLLLVAQMQAMLGDVAGASAQLEAAPTEIAHTPAIAAERAKLLIQLGRLKDAAGVDRQLLQIEPRNFAVRQELMNLLIRLKQGDAAIAVIRDGLKLQPGDGQLLQAYVAATWRISGLDAGLALAEKLRKDPANLPAARLLKGGLLMAAGRPADAVAAYDSEIKAIAPFGDLVVAKARALRALGRIDEARTILTDWLASESDPTVADALAALEIEQKRLDAAARALRIVLSLRPDDPVALNNLAWVYQQQNDPKAITLGRRAYLINPSGEMADTLGWILTQQNKPQLGLLLLRQASMRLPRDPSVYYHLAVALNDSGNSQEAARVLKGVLSSSTAFGERDAAEALQRKLAATAPQ